MSKVVPCQEQNGTETYISREWRRCWNWPYSYTCTQYRYNTVLSCQKSVEINIVIIHIGNYEATMHSCFCSCLPITLFSPTFYPRPLIILQSVLVQFRQVYVLFNVVLHAESDGAFSFSATSSLAAISKKALVYMSHLRMTPYMYRDSSRCPEQMW